MGAAVLAAPPIQPQTVGAVGDGGTVHQIQQIWSQGSIDVSKLAEPLGQLSDAMNGEN
jgi:hypothetical protein